jgi:sec-independent protein translocase protein TatA
VQEENMHLPVGFEWLVILVVVVLLFGAKKIPDLAKGLGEGLKEFKKASKDAEKEIKDAKDATAKDKPEEKSEAKKKE